MVYLGVCLGHGEGTAQVVAVEKDYFSGSKSYRIAHVETLNEPDSASLTKILQQLALDDRWATVKKVFSQNGRPPKLKKEPPLILLSAVADDPNGVEKIFSSLASAEMVVGGEPDAAFRERVKADLYHNCHVVSAGMMLSSLVTALQKGSLKAAQLTADLAAPLSPLAHALLENPGSAPALERSTPWLCALGSCIWHGESIRRIKRY